MAHSIAENLLDQAREHLAKSDFENAAKSARAVLALDSENSDASDILKASEAATGADSSNDESVTKYHLKLVAVKVQGAINAKNLDQAERLIHEYLKSYPDVPDANQILEDVLAAKRQKVADDRQRYLAQISDGPVNRQYQHSPRDEAGCLNYGLSFVFGGILGLFIQYILRFQGWTAVKINAAIFIAAMILIIIFL